MLLAITIWIVIGAIIGAVIAFQLITGRRALQQTGPRLPLEAWRGDRHET